MENQTPEHGVQQSGDGPALSPAAEDWSALLVRVGSQQDRQAFQRLFEHFAPMVKSYVLQAQNVFGPALADELVQDVMVKVWRRASSFDPEKASASTWIFTIARNSRIDLIRREQKLASPLSADDIWEPGAEEEPLMALQRKREESGIRQHLDQLPADQLQVLVKVYMEGKSHSEVAAELALPLGTVKTRVRLALKKLKVLVDR